MRLFYCPMLPVQNLSFLYLHPFRCNISFASYHPAVLSMHSLFGRHFFAICCEVQGTLTLLLKTKYCAKSGTLYFLILIQKDCCCSKRKLSVLSLDKGHALENTIYLTRTFELQDIFSNEKEGKEQVNFS